MTKGQENLVARARKRADQWEEPQTAWVNDVDIRMVRDLARLVEQFATDRDEYLRRWLAA